MHLGVFNQTDNEQLQARRWTNQFHEIPFANAFLHPQQVAIRTPVICLFSSNFLQPMSQLSPVPLRTAVADDLIQDYLRCFVLFSDWLMQWEEFRQFKYGDQVGYSVLNFKTFKLLANFCSE